MVGYFKLKTQIISSYLRLNDNCGCQAHIYRTLYFLGAKKICTKVTCGDMAMGFLPIDRVTPAL